MKSLIINLLSISLLQVTAIGETTEAKPVKALLITGGCCHDYKFQAASLSSHPSEAANIDGTIAHDGGDKKDFQNPLYDNHDWAKPYDVVVHNECFAGTTDADYIRKITNAHRGGTPAVVIHCAMHSYRDAKIDDWREFLGVTSRHH